MNPFYDAVENEVLRALNAVGVDYVVIGGAAVQFHGVERLRKDIDILLRTSSENVEALRKALNLLTGAKYPLTQDHLDRLAKPAMKWGLTGPYNGVDFLGHVADFTYDEIKEAAAVQESEAGRVPVISKPHLLAAKRFSGRPEDMADIEALNAL